jgi:hypothetical protein
MDLYTMMKDYAGSDEPANMLEQTGRDGSMLNIYPSLKKCPFRLISTWFARMEPLMQLTAW